MQRPVTRRTCFESSKFTVQSWRFDDPQLGAFDRDVVVHPGAVLILPLLQDGSVVMIRNVRDSIGRELLELPAGTLEPDESPRDCAGRELEEETGYRAGILEPLCDFYTTPGFCTEKMYAFVARDLTRTAARPDPLERIRTTVFPPQDILSILVDGSIEDGKTLAALGVFILRTQGAS